MDKNQVVELLRELADAIEDSRDNRVPPWVAAHVETMAQYYSLTDAEE
jgi:hypothetical protein